ncbi:hypothetical protein ACOMHN_013803 [Nucella lapillus]
MNVVCLLAPPGTYYCLNMILITLSSFLNAFVVYMSFYGARRPVPRYLKKVLFGFFGHLLCMDNLVRPYLECNNHASDMSASATRGAGGGAGGGGGGESGGGGLGRLPQDCTRFLGVNGDSGGSGSKWVNDSRASTEILVHINRAGSGDEQLNQLALINYHLTELMDFVKRYKERLAEKDRRERMAKEWKAAGLVFDRIFFLIYLIAIITSLCVLMPIITMGYQPTDGKI